MSKAAEFGDELRALGSVLEALQPLDPEKRRFVISSAVQKFEIRLEGMVAPSGSTSSAGISPADSAESAKAFLKRKHPTTVVQRIACLAYYVTHQRKTPHFKTRDLTDLNTEAASGEIGNPAQAVENATKQNQFLSPVGKGRKQITVVGEDVVDALPNQEKVKVVIEAATAGRRKRRVRTRKKKQS
jgi:hypothetical protein